MQRKSGIETMEYTEVKWKVREIVAKIFSDDTQKVTLTTNIYDYPCDSLDVFDLQCELELSFGITMDSNDFRSGVVKDIADTVYRKKKANETTN